MAELTDAEIDAALDRGQAARRSQARAVLARFEQKSGRVVIDLSNGCVFAFPAALAQGLETATAEQLEMVEILGSGSGLHWEALDVDLSVPDLLAGFFGTRAYLAKRASQTKRDAKARSGRPRRVADHSS